MATFEPLNVKAYGAVGDGVADDTAAIQAALDEAALLHPTAGMGYAVIVPAGNYTITSTITVPSRTKLVGEGRRASRLNFVPTANDVMIDCFHGTPGNRVFDIEIRNFEFVTTTITHDKTMLRIIGAEDCRFHELTIRMSDVVGNHDDVCIAFSGRENTSFRDLRLTGPVPIRIYSDSDAGANDVGDNINFHNIAMIPSPDPSTHPSTGIWIDDVNVSNFTFTGSGVAAGGDHLLRWVTTGGANTQGFVMQGWRHEQGGDAATHSIHMDLTNAAESVVLQGIRTPPECGAIYSRNVNVNAMGCTWAANTGVTAALLDIEGGSYCAVNCTQPGDANAVAPVYADTMRSNLVIPKNKSQNLAKGDHYQFMDTPTTNHGHGRLGALFGASVLASKFSVPATRRQQSRLHGVAGCECGVLIIAAHNRVRDIYAGGTMLLAGGPGWSARGVLDLSSTNMSATANNALTLNIWTNQPGAGNDTNTCYVQNYLALWDGTVTVDAGTDVITSTAHTMSDGTVVQFWTTGTLPAGLAADTDYFVISSATDTFKVSATQGGSAIDITDTGSGTHSVGECILGTYFWLGDGSQPPGNEWRQRVNQSSS